MKSIYIIDDDLGVLSILEDIVKNYFPGSFAGSAATGEDALKDVLEDKPDLILLDYLLPDMDGLGVIRKINKEYFPAIIIISEVSDKKMIAKAYNEKIEFFINKPINVVEVVSVINRVIELQEIKGALNKFDRIYSSIMSNIDRRGAALPFEDVTDEQKLRKLYSKLGIIGSSGCEELIKGVMWAKSQYGEYLLSSMYSHIAENINEEQNSHSIEKRIRRIISKSFKSMASLGIEDSMNPIFENYSGQLFDFSEMRKEMKYLSGKSKIQGKINIKQFIESSIVLIDEL